MKIIELPPADARVRQLIEEHLRYCAAHTPRGSGHAVDTSAATTTGIRYFVALASETPLGCIGLRPLSQKDAELKTMHVLAAARGQGTGERLVHRLVDTARREGFERLFLETGSSDGFAASRRLYLRTGFEACEAFGDYAEDPFSYCMTRRL
jgi:putative acetyltransferase